MNSEDLTQQLPDSPNDRELLLELRAVMFTVVDRIGELEKRTNPLPPNFDGRFAAMEKLLVEFKAEMKTELRMIREDMRNEQRARHQSEERLERLEERLAA